MPRTPHYLAFAIYVSSSKLPKVWQAGSLVAYGFPVAEGWGTPEPVLQAVGTLAQATLFETEQDAETAIARGSTWVHSSVRFAVATVVLGPDDLFDDPRDGQ